MAAPLRIFISSPGDVLPERRRAQLIIEKLAKEFARFFDIEAVSWDTEPMLASGHFQDQIVPPSETDIVILIVWSRLGTPLPAKTETREYHGIDGRAPVTGTEWEFEDALAAQRSRGAPDLLAYRKEAAPVVSLADKAAKADAERQWDQLDSFWNRWFVDRGQFRAAFSSFPDLDGFEAKFENDLRRLIETRVRGLEAAGSRGPAPIWYRGSPFRGLETYRFEHAPIFFGRSAMTKAAVEQLSRDAEGGRAFLLILGASGAGKSSLAQAGALPALTGRGIVPGVGLWRRAVMRPGGHPEGPFAALADALVGPSALPELTAGNQDPAALARHLEAAADDPSYPVVAALDAVERSARERGEILRIETARLALVIDQLEELFTASDLPPAVRRAFVACIDGLARCGRVFVLATMRSDYWHRAADTPLLVEMAGGDGRLDLLPPVQDEILEMIRQPAAAAGLAFERDPVRDIGLDATLAAEAVDEPGALPLLSFLLDELYRRDVSEGRGSVLTFATMRGLGGLKEAIANRAEAAFASLPQPAQAAFPRVLRELVTVGRSGAEPTARSVPLTRFPDGGAERRFVAAFLDPQVRLLVAEGDGDGARIRAAHEALIANWQRARLQIAQDRDDLRTRTVVEEAEAEWRGAPAQSKRGYLLHDPQLANAVDLVRRWPGELDAPLVDFVQASRARARRRQQWAIAAAAVFAMLAVAASIFGGLAYRAQQQTLIARAQAASEEADRRAALAQQLASAGRPQLAAAVTLDAAPFREGDKKPLTPALAAALRRALGQVRIPVERNLGENVFNLAISPDGRTVAAGTVKGVVYVLDAATLQERFHFTSGDDVVSGLSFSPDGARILATGAKIPNVWDAATGKKLFDLNRPDVRRFAKSARFSPDGSRIVVGTAENRALIYDAADGTLLHVLPGADFEEMVERLSKAHTSEYGVADPIVHAVAQSMWRIWGAATDALFSPDGKLVAVTGPATPDGSVLLYDAQSGRLVRTLSGGDGTLFTPPMNYGQMLWFSPDGSSVVADPLERTIKIWNVADGSLRAEFASRGITSFMLTEDGEAAISAHDNGSLIVRCLSGHGAVVSIQAHEGSVETLVADRPNRLFATGSTDRTARLWQMPKSADICDLKAARNEGYERLSVAQPIAIFTGHGARVTNAVFSPDDRLLLTSSQDGWVRSWVTAPADVLATGPLGSEAIVSSDGRILLATKDGAWRAWDAVSGAEIPLPQDVAAVAPGAAGEQPILFTGPYEHFRLGQRAAGPAGGDAKDELLGWAGPVSPDGSRIVVPEPWFRGENSSPVSGDDDTQLLLDPGTKKALARLAVAERKATDFRFSPDGARLFGRLEGVKKDNGAGADGLAVWDARSGELIATATEIEGLPTLSALSFAASGERFLVPNADTGLRLFAIVGKEIKQIAARRTARRHGMTAAALSADGTLVVTGDAKGAVAVIAAETNELRQVLDTRGVGIGVVSISPDRRYIAAADASNTLWMFDAGTGDVVHSLTLAFRPDDIRFFPTSDRLLALGDEDSVIAAVLPTVVGTSAPDRMIDWARKGGLNLVSEEDARRYKLGSAAEHAGSNGRRGWAALDPDSEDTAPVVWADTENEAQTKALAACRKVSNTCSSKAAVTQDADALFVTLCCANPRLGCMTAPGAGDEALLSAKRTLYGAGFANCWVGSVRAAADGRRR